MMGFQPLNSGTVNIQHHLEEGEIAPPPNIRKRLYEEASSEMSVDKRLRMAPSQQDSPEMQQLSRVGDNHMRQTSDEEYIGENGDSADGEWMAGVRGRYRRDQMDRQQVA